MRRYLLFAAVLLASPAGANMPVLWPAPRDPALMCNGLDAADGLAGSKWEDGGDAAPQEGEFFFSGPEKSLAALDSGLHDLGFATRPMRANPGRVATIDATIDQAWLHAMMPRLCKLAGHLGVEYDGWEAARPQPQSTP
jgi:hypothetical protein